MEAAFDPVAQDYDRQFTDTATGRWQRAVVYDWLVTWLNEVERPSVLELNCGTGADARWLAKRGAQVRATDLSAEMVAVGKAKDKDSLVKWEAGDLRQVVRRDGALYDLVFSNFGGLNCISPADFQQLEIDLRNRVRSGGRFAAVIMGRFCGWETLYFGAKLRLGAAVRRWRGGPVQAPLGDGAFQATWYFSPRQMRDWFSDHWEMEELRPVGFFVPPSYLDPFFEKRPKLLERLGELDWESRDLAARAGGSDHYLVAFRRK